MRAGEEIWKRYRIPIYLYEAAARVPERINLADVRRGVRATPPGRPTSAGPNITLVPALQWQVQGRSLSRITSSSCPRMWKLRRVFHGAVRASSGGLPNVKAMGVFLEARDQAQVSMNLTDYEVTPPHRAFEAVRHEAERLGIEVASSEVVGLIPRKALEMAAGHDLKLEGFMKA